MATKMTPRELAEQLHTDEKVVRKFLREVTPPDQHPGLGKRWAIPGTQASLKKLRKQFDLWSVNHEVLLKHHAS